MESLHVSRQKVILASLLGTLGVLVVLLVAMIAAGDQARRMLADAHTRQVEKNVGIDTKLSLENQTGVFFGETNQPLAKSVSEVGGCLLTASIEVLEHVDAEVTYQTTIQNVGTQECRKVAYSAYYRVGERYQSAEPRPAANNNYFVIGTLKPSQIVTGTITTVVQERDEYGVDICAVSENYAKDACADIGANIAPLTLTQSNRSAEVLPISSPFMTTKSLFSSSQSQEYGVWVWNSAMTMSDAKMDQVISQADIAGFNVIYITIDDIVDHDIAAYKDRLALFVAKATAAGIAVDAAAGASHWAQPEYRSMGYEMIHFAMEYNADTSHPPLRGFQYDVEPYLLPHYEDNKDEVLTEFVTFISESAAMLSDSNLRFGVVIPHFYDAKQAWTPEVVVDGVSAHTFDHLVRILDQNQQSSIIIMAYRNYFSGPNGTREIVEAEINHSGATKVIVAQEVGNVEPAYVTFYGTTRTKLLASLQAIDTTFKNRVGYGGIAVHYLEPLYELKD